MTRLYGLQDVYDYLMRFYNLEWRGYQIKDFRNKGDNYERGISSWDFRDDKADFQAIAILYLGAKQKTVKLDVSNDELSIYEIEPERRHYAKPKITWKQFLDRMYGQEQCLSR
jgi:hypothetical protein